MTDPVRHPSTVAKMEHFAYEHLPVGLQDISKRIADVAQAMFEDHRMEGEQLTLGFQKLIEAKDCFVRAALPAIKAAQGGPSSSTSS